MVVNTYLRDVVLEFTDDMAVLEYLLFVLQESVVFLYKCLHF